MGYAMRPSPPWSSGAPNSDIVPGDQSAPPVSLADSARPTPTPPHVRCPICVRAARTHARRSPKNALRLEVRDGSTHPVSHVTRYPMFLTRHAELLQMLLTAMQPDRRPNLPAMFLTAMQQQPCNQPCCGSHATGHATGHVTARTKLRVTVLQRMFDPLSDERALERRASPQSARALASGNGGEP